MKILPLVRGIQNDILSSGKLLKNASQEGYKIANRTSKVYNQNNLQKYYNITKCVSYRVLKNTSRRELAYLGGAVGMLIPIPLMSLLLFGLGLLARISPKGANIIYDKSSQAHHINIRTSDGKNGLDCLL